MEISHGNKTDMLCGAFSRYFFMCVFHCVFGRMTKMSPGWTGVRRISALRFSTEHKEKEPFLISKDDEFPLTECVLTSD